MISCLPVKQLRWSNIPCKYHKCYIFFSYTNFVYTINVLLDKAHCDIFNILFILYINRTIGPQNENKNSETEILSIPKQMQTFFKGVLK